ncbi:dihydrolipoyl dehydrogenase [Sphingomonas metalli]|uniref:Dihydrolipoyl dehydrogenase n=1 Tax=Sphingomonas metalli TaxID=1779358 RepID=A0A916WRN0_9SPHN|nr:dihydrolipoyl dehydrogenase [Sphingomonas metalli]GGB23146.1 dihydrolipoyl dehydrogenase [Sphingomonas metalli]
MEDRRCGVAVIGAGTAGLHAYEAAWNMGADTLLIEQGSGGTTCTRYGCMPSKALLAAAHAAHAARRAGGFGIRTGDIHVDGEAVMARVRALRDRFFAAVLEDYDAIPADHRLHGTACFTGPDRLVVGDTTIHADAIVIATGARPIVPESLDPVRALVHTHETIFDIETLPRSLAVLGAGPVGLELAQAFARLGVAVTLFDEDDIVGGLGDPQVNASARAALSQEVTMRLGVTVTAEAQDGRARLSWTGAEAGSESFDLILAATGRPPCLDPLALDTTGLALDDHGTPLFDHRTRRCGDSAIFVAGDAGSWRPVLHEAARGGRIAGMVAAGGEAPRVLPAFAITFTDPQLVEVGTGFADLPDGARIGEAKPADNGRAVIERTTEGLVRLYADRDGRLIGASIAAAEAEHLGHGLALAIDRGISMADFADQPWYHPTLEELLQQAARDALGED